MQEGYEEKSDVTMKVEEKEECKDSEITLEKKGKEFEDHYMNIEEVQKQLKSRVPKANDKRM